MSALQKPVQRQTIATPAAANRLPGRSGAKAVGTYVPKLTKRAFEKFGFSTAALITDWPQIVGSALAGVTRPDRIKWPRVAAIDLDDGVPGAGRTGATLVLSVAPERALDVQYQAALIADRVNTYFGYRAIGKVVLVQAPFQVPDAGLADTTARRSSGTRISPVMPQVEAIADQRLKVALQRMATGVANRRRT